MWSFFIVIIAICCEIPAASASTSKTTYVKGYPLLNFQTDSKLLDPANPIFGRLACPSLTRLNLLEKRSEPFLLEKVDILTQEGKTTWELKLKPDLRWWNGDKITSEDLNLFIVKELKPTVEKLGLGLWVVPEFEVHSESAQRLVKIIWSKPPSFGPYILNRISFFRPKGNEFECAGDYKLEKQGSQFIFVPQNPKLQTVIAFTEDEKPAIVPDFTFQLAEAITQLDAKTTIKEAPTCTRPIDLPIVSVISWNPKGPLSGKASFRKAISLALPKAALVKVGTSQLGDLLSGPLLRAHPGYDRSLQLPLFDLNGAQKQLDQQGFIRPLQDVKRTDKNGLAIELKVYIPNQAGLVQKVFADSLNMLGIRVSFTHQTSDSVDAALTGMMLSWPEADFLDLFHSKSRPLFPFWSLNQPELDQWLEKYALSLTTQQPDFEALQAIHRILYAEEPLTILVQHRSCLVANTKSRSSIQKILIRNPDWFFELING